MAAKITATRGDTFTLTVPVTSSGTAVNLTGYKAYFTVKPSINVTDNTNDDASALLQITVASVSNPTAGIITFSATATTMSAITPGSYFYDIELIDGSGNVTTIGPGPFILNGDITRAVS